jgi:hypothetical protein
VPQDIAKFYERNNLETPLNADEEAAKGDDGGKDKKGKKSSKG